MMRPENSRNYFAPEGLKQTVSASSVLRKLKEVAGDSIAEALVAVLIAALGAALLATMVTSSMNATANSEARLTALHAAETELALEKSSAAESADSLGTVSITGGGIAGVYDMQATLYSTDDYATYAAVRSDENAAGN